MLQKRIEKIIINSELEKILRYILIDSEMNRYVLNNKIFNKRENKPILISTSNYSNEIDKCLGKYPCVEDIKRTIHYEIKDEVKNKRNGSFKSREKNVE